MKWTLLPLLLLALTACEQRNPEPRPKQKKEAPAILVDINHASLKELEALPAVGEVYAAKIIAGRPYANKTQLRSRGIVPDHVYEEIHDLVIARQSP